MVTISGSTGFIGQNLLLAISNAAGLSVRTEGWREDLKFSSTIINLIGKAHDHKGTATEQDFFYANVELTKQVFEAYMASAANLLIHISSLAAIEEFEANKPLTEGDSCHPVSAYGRSKRAAEEWLMAQELPTGKKLIIIRPPMVHGPGDKGNLGLLYKMVSKGIPYPLTAFDNNRSFISIANFCYYIQQIMEHREKLDSGIYHIADDEPLSTKDIIRIMQQVTGKNTLHLPIPQFFIKSLAKLGDYTPFPLNTKRLKKMTSNLLVSNQKVKTALSIEKLPLTAQEGLEITIKSFRAMK